MGLLKKFEDREFNGPLAEYINNCKPHRVEAIYDTEYRYIKEIVYDEEKQSRYGSSREGYERYKRDMEGYASYSGELDLRVQKSREGEVLGYFTESKLTSNESYKIMMQQYDMALSETKKILGVNDDEAFMFWLETEFSWGFRNGANEIISGIEKLEGIIARYESDHDFKRFIDKVKV